MRNEISMSDKPVFDKKECPRDRRRRFYRFAFVRGAAQDLARDLS
jgi:hypothetical protein